MPLKKHNRYRSLTVCLASVAQLSIALDSLQVYSAALAAVKQALKEIILELLRKRKPGSSC